MYLQKIFLLHYIIKSEKIAAYALESVNIFSAKYIWANKQTYSNCKIYLPSTDELQSSVGGGICENQFGSKTLEPTTDCPAAHSNWRRPCKGRQSTPVGREEKASWTDRIVFFWFYMNGFSVDIGNSEQWPPMASLCSISIQNREWKTRRRK